MWAEGSKFGSKYSTFLQSVSSPDEYKIISTPIGRSIESAYYFLTGIQKYREILPANTNMDIKLEYLKRHNLLEYGKDENILFGAFGGRISQKAQEWSDQKLEELWREGAGKDKFGESLEEISKVIGVPVQDLNYWHLFFVHDTLHSYIQNDRPLSPSFHSQMYNNLSDVPFIIFYDMWMYNRYIRRLANYVILRQIIEATERGGRAPKFIYYASHASNIVGILVAFGFVQKIYPDFGASLIIEIMKGDLVRVIYSNKHEEIVIYEGGKKEFISILQSELFESDEEFLQAVGNSRLIENQNNMKFKLFETLGI